MSEYRSILIDRDTHTGLCLKHQWGKAFSLHLVCKKRLLLRNISGEKHFHLHLIYKKRLLVRINSGEKHFHFHKWGKAFSFASGM